MSSPGSTKQLQSLLPSVGSKNYLALLRMRLTSLLADLPAGSSNTFTIRRYGNSYGIPNVCPYCDWEPSEDTKPWNRRRAWGLHLSSHIKNHQK